VARSLLFLKQPSHLASPDQIGKQAVVVLCVLDPTGYDCPVHFVRIGVTKHFFWPDYVLSIKVKIIRQQCGFGKLVRFLFMAII
jgi:hypothetical protein